MGLGDEEIIDAALRVQPEQRSRLVRDACDGDEVQYARLMALVRLAGATKTEGGEMCPKVVEEGASLGRYVVQRHLGTGGMGSVYAAYDTTLDRRVALKVLHSAVERRIEREARLLARVEHRNVVGIYDVGMHEGVAFISMEYVEGITLRRWMATPRRWRDVVELMLRAGRGLQAAHEVGVVHRDFKPENVLLSADDQRVAVTDFGIARLSDDSHHVTGESDDPAPAQTSSTETVRGGTPAYMAPEQWAGELVDQRTDVFAFCVVLYEALFRCRPFPQAFGSASAEPATIPRSPCVPGWLARAVLRGLSLERDARWPSIEALLDRIERERRHQRARGVLATGAAVVAIALSGQQIAEMRSNQECERDARSIERTWNRERAADLRDAYEWRALPYGSDAATRVVSRLDAWSDAWATERNAACRAAHEDARPVAELEATRQCLDRGHARFTALVDLLAAPDDELVQYSIEAAAALAAPQDCRNARASQPIASNDDVAAGLAQASAELSARRLEASIHTGKRVAARARRSGDTAAALEAELVAGVAQARIGRHDEARETLHAVFEGAGRGGNDHLALRAATALVTVEGIALAKPERGRLWADLAQVLAARLELVDDPILARLIHARGMLASEQGDYTAALEDLRAGAELVGRVLGEDHPLALEYWSSVGVTLFRRGDHDEAEGIQRSVLRRQEALLGPRHPDVALEVANVAAVQFERGDYEGAQAGFERAIAIEADALGEDAVALAGDLEYLGLIHERLGQREPARQAHERALELRRRAFGEDHPKVAFTLHHIGVLDYQLGDFEAALARHLRAVSIVERIHGPEHPDLGGLLSGVGAAYNALGEPQRALATYRRALSIASTTFGPDHFNVGLLRHNIGVALHKLGRHEESLPELERALAIAIDAWGEDHPRLVELHRSHANALAELGRSDEAVEASERAAALAEAGRVPPVELARARFRLAQQLVRADQDRPRALALAGQALSTFESLDASKQIAEVKTWMDNTEPCERCTKRRGRSQRRSSAAG